MRDKLIELVRNASAKWYQEAVEKTTKKSSSAYIADDLLANGVIVPPCKVGDVVYTYLNEWRKEDGIAPYQITNITITQNKKGEWIRKYRAMWFVNGKTADKQINFSFDEIGKKVFLTRETAERALKGGAE